MSKIKKIFTNWRVLLLIACLLIAAWTIHYNPYKEGVAIRSVTYNSSVNEAGIAKPQPGLMPMSREVILSIDNQQIKTIKDFYDITEKLEANTTVDMKTSKEIYRVYVRPLYNITELDELETYDSPVMINDTVTGKLVPKTEIITKTVERTAVDSATGETYTIPEQVNETKVVTEKKTRHKILYTAIGKEDLGLSVYPAPTSNIKKGLDLDGGTRVILAPAETADDEQLQMLAEIIKNRLNVYGLSDISVRLFGVGNEQYIIVEIAGATKQEVIDLLAKQGKFEARIENKTVFVGGEDITFVCTDPSCSRIYQCGMIAEQQYICKFDFSIKLSADAAKKFGSATSNLDVVQGSGEKGYLSAPIVFLLDDNEVDSLQIAQDLKGSETTDIAISGPGYGKDKAEAYTNADENRKKLVTVLKTGSLPMKLNIENSVTMSAIAGEQFVRNSLMLGFIAIFAVAIVVFGAYRKLRISIPIILTLASEIVLLLGLAALLKWNLDFSAIAGIIIVIGTGVDSLIVLTDEILRGEKADEASDWKKRFKDGFMIILMSFMTTAAAMIPLIFAGAGLLRGFAIITIAGLAMGIFISRPAYAAVIEVLLKE